MGGEEKDNEIIKKSNERSLTHVFLEISQLDFSSLFVDDEDFSDCSIDRQFSLLNESGNNVRVAINLNIVHDKQKNRLNVNFLIDFVDDEDIVAEYNATFIRENEGGDCFISDPQNFMQPFLHVRSKFSNLGVGSGCSKSINSHLYPNLLKNVSSILQVKTIKYRVIDGSGGWSSRRALSEGFNQAGTNIYEKIFSIQD